MDKREHEQIAAEVQALDPTPAPGQSLQESAAEFTSRTAITLRTQAERLRQEITESAAADKAQIEAEIAAMKADLERRQRQARDLLAPLQEKMKRLNEQVWTMGLYLGEGEEIVPLAQGERAPEGTPLSLRQQVMYMDEESAIANTRTGVVLDFKQIDVFDSWLTEDPRNRDQVIPETKAVVALSPRRHGLDYGDSLLNAVNAEENAWTYFLIRNGENLWRLRTDFKTGKHLMPVSTEFTDLFRGRDGSTLEPGSRDWDEAEKHQGNLQRHYMRVALILQGLVDRTTVLHPLPEGGLNLLAQSSFDSGMVQVIADAEALLTDGRPSFREWVRALNARLEPGMRIMGNFRDERFRDEAKAEVSMSGFYPSGRMPGLSREDHWANEWPENATIYQTQTATTFIGSTEHLMFTFPAASERYVTTGSGWSRRDELRVPNKRIKVLINRNDQFILPIDLIHPEDLAYYLGSRNNRREYESLIPLMNAALAAIEAEREAEAPFRALIADRIAQAHPEHPREAIEAVLPDLIQWYKVGNRVARALVTGGKDEAKALRMILDEYRQRSARDKTDIAVLAALRSEHPDALVIGQFPNGTYRVLVASPSLIPAKAATQKVWVDEHRYTKTGKHQRSETETTVNTQWSRATILHQKPEWASWKRVPPPGALTDSQVMSLVEQALDRPEAQER